MYIACEFRNFTCRFTRTHHSERSMAWFSRFWTSETSISLAALLAWRFSMDARAELGPPAPGGGAWAEASCWASCRAAAAAASPRARDLASAMAPATPAFLMAAAASRAAAARPGASWRSPSAAAPTSASRLE